MDCTCYVQHLEPEDRFTLRYGAHNATCPKYRRSGDPLDHQRDEEFRARVEPLDLSNPNGGWNPVDMTPEGI